MDEGESIAYSALEHNVPVLDCDGAQVGTVESVLAAPEEDIFHGLLVRMAAGSRFVEAADIASIHERGVDLTLDAAAIAALPQPEHVARVWHAAPDSLHGGSWGAIRDRFSGHRGWR